MKGAVVNRGDAESEDKDAEIDEELMNKLMTPQKALDQYEQIFNQKTEFFSTYNPDMIEEALVQYLHNEYKVEPIVNKNKYKIKF